MDITERLAAPFSESDVKSRPGRGGLTFAYIDARAVMNRLDEVFGLGGWSSSHRLVDSESGAVECTLTLHLAVFNGVSHSDVGYPNSDRSEEPLKDAYSDSLKRAAVRLGIGRYLYELEPGETKPKTDRESEPCDHTSDSSEDYTKEARDELASLYAAAGLADKKEEVRQELVILGVMDGSTSFPHVWAGLSEGKKDEVWKLAGAERPTSDSQE
jgi:hypothetical protein